MTAYNIHPMQTAWLSLEDKKTPMHLGVLVYFKLPRSADSDFVQKLAGEMREHQPNVAPWNLCLHRSGLGFFKDWRFRESSDVDLDYHFRHSALPAPGGERQMGELVSRLHSHPMDLSKPLWEAHLIEGMHGGRFALYLKLHPAVFDTASSLTLLRKLFATSARQKATLPIWALALKSERGQSNPFSDWPALLKALAHRLRNGFRHPVSWAGLKGVPRTALNDRVSGARRFATQQYATERLEKVAKPLAVSVEELLYYLTSSALRRFFKEFNALPERPMIALVADRSRRDGMLNPLFVNLATHRASKRQRLDDIKRSLTLARKQYAMLDANDAKAESTLDAMPYLFRQALGIDHHLSPSFNLGIARLSMGEEARYWNGARLESVFPMPMLLQGGALNMAFMQYNKGWNIGLCGARDNLPHLQRIAVYMGKALEELEEALKS